MLRKQFILILLLMFPVTVFAKTTDSSKNIIEKKIPYFLVPGAGQIKNRKWVKSFVLIGAEVAAINFWSKNALIYKKFDESRYDLPQNRYLEKRNKYAWWIVIIYFYSMIDAVVDNHFFDFNEVMNKPIEKEIVKERKDLNEE